METSVLLSILRLSEDQNRLDEAVSYSEGLLQEEVRSIPIEIERVARRVERLKSERARLHRSLLHLEPTALPQSILSDIKLRDHEIEDEEARYVALQAELDELSIVNRDREDLEEALRLVKPTLLQSKSYPTHRLIRDLVRGVELRDDRLGHITLSYAPKNLDESFLRGHKKEKRPWDYPMISKQLGLRDSNPRPSG